MTPGLVPIVRNQGKTFREALKLIWIRHGPDFLGRHSSGYPGGFSGCLTGKLVAY
jgi:hypothetical protein